MLRCHYAATLAVSSLTLCVNALEETRRAQKHFANSSNFDNVYTDGNNHN